jgi:ankyrin repeat protein
MVDFGQTGVRWRFVIAIAALLLIGVGTTVIGIHWRRNSIRRNVCNPAAESNIASNYTPLPVSRYFSKSDVQKLLVMASKRDLAGVRALLALHPDLSTERGKGGISPLHAALFANDAATFETLLAAGLDRNVPADNGITPLMAAAMLPNQRFLEVALANISVVPKQSDGKGRDALHLAILNRQAANVWILLSKGVDPNHEDIRGSTPLMAAFQGRRPSAKIVQMLLKAGANPAMVDRSGLKARDFALSFNDPAILSMLP